MNNLNIHHFLSHFENTGLMGPICEKAFNNFHGKRLNDTNKMHRIHYFAIGHAFKQIDTKSIFEYAFNEFDQEEAPTKFLILQANNFLFEEKLYGLIKNIRNLNSHYAHTFDKLEVNQKIDANVIEFLKESFELAVLQIYLKEKKQVPNETEIKTFLKRMFFSTKKDSKYDSGEQKEINKNWNIYVNNLNTKEAVINALLFITVENEFYWNIENEVPVLKIKKGTYLSFEACLFLTSMFLYKNEANHLIPKIKGYKRSEGNKMKSKRELFSYFSKKFTSQDVDAEESHLVKFRDMVQYLNHYPTTWNSDLKLESENKNPIMTKALTEQIITMEIYRTYPVYSGNNDFAVFAKNYLFSNKKKLDIKYITNALTAVEKEFYEEITQNPHIKTFKNEIAKATQPIKYNLREEPFKIFVKQYVLKTYFPNKSGYDAFKKHKFEKNKISGKTEDVEKQFQEQLNINPNTEKLIKRILQDTLIKSYGRNQDRFLDFSMRYLAEKNYFGKDVSFKCYQFYNNFEQEDFVKTYRKTHSKKECDNLKYHNGRLVHFTTYQNHLKTYPEWDTPFVNENNAISIKITLGNIEKIIPVQRNLIIYFLEDSLYNNSFDGKGLLTKYYHQSYRVDYLSYNKTLLEENSNNTITKEEKASFKKLLPKRLLHHYLPAVQNNLPEYNTLEKLLRDAEKREKTYNDLFEKTKQLNLKINQNLKKEQTAATLLEDFKKRNKGKRFKLQFIRKACHFMFFKDTYKAQAQEGNHHKRYHITKDEFDDFCKWMYAFEGDDYYKNYLHELFEAKGFYLNPDFKKLFSSSTSLENLFIKVKNRYKDWLVSNTTVKDRTLDYNLDTKKNVYVLNTNMFYINVSHFIKFLETNQKIKRANEKLIYNSLENETFLIEAYYFKNHLEKSEYKSCRKLYNKLKSNKLEDALLFEIAIKYLSLGNTLKNNVAELLLQNLEFEIKNRTNSGSFKLTVPFNKIDSYVTLISQKRNQEDSKYKTSFLGALQAYLSINLIPNGKDKTGKPVYLKGDLQFEDLNKVNNYVIIEALKFSRMLMLMEAYFIHKDKNCIADNGYYIDAKDIASMQAIAKVWNIEHTIETHENTTVENFRNCVLHFSLPLGKTVTAVVKDVETLFIKTEISKTSNFDALTDSQKKVCFFFIKVLHNMLCYNRDLFSKHELHLKNNTNEKHKRANNQYFKKVING